MSSRKPFIGIDFGTSKSSMAWYNPDTGRAEIIRNAQGEDKTPSVVYFGENETLVGTPAEEMLPDETERQRVIISVKRDLVSAPTLALPDGKRVKPVEVAAAILGKLKRDAEALHFHEPVTRAVITYPAAFDILEQEAIAEAGKLAGFSEITLLAEPVAAAIAYQQAGLEIGDHILVYDLGGGTFDLAVLVHDQEQLFRLALAPKGIRRCGGDDFDRQLYEHCDEIALKHLGRSISPIPGLIDLEFLRECRKRKEALSSQNRSIFNAYLPTKQGTAVRFRHTLERSTLEELIRLQLEETVQRTKNVLEDANRLGYPVDMIVLIGGATRIPLVEQILLEALPIEPLRWHLQDVAVALGAAYYAYYLWGQTLTEITVSPDGSGLTLEQAIEAIAEGGTIRLTEGTYRLSSPLLIERSMRLIGAGMDATAIVGDSEEYVVKFAGAGQLEMEGITFRYEGNSWADVVVATGDEVNLAQCRFTGGVRDKQAKRGGNGLLLSGTLKGQVSQCRMESNEQCGIRVNEQAQPLLDKNTCRENKNGIAYWGTANGVARQNQCISNQLVGIGIGKRAQPELEANNCRKNQVGILYTDNASGIAHDNQCVGNKRHGIYVGKEAYPNLDKNICSENKRNGITYHGMATGIAHNNQCMGNELHGIEVRGQAQPQLEANTTGTNKYNGIYYKGNASGRAHNNQCVDNNQDGIHVCEQAQPRLEENICRENKHNGIVYFGTANGIARQNQCVGNEQHGIYVDQQAQPQLEANICRENKQSGISYYDNASGIARQNLCMTNEIHGIYVDQQAQPQLDGNTCQQNKQNGIAYFSNTSGVAQQNNCIKNEQNGIYVSQQAQPELEQNTCRENKQNGIGYHDYASGMARQNQCVGNEQHGIYVSEQADPQLEENICQENKQDGIFYSGTASGVACQNQCLENERNGIQIRDKAQPFLEGNNCQSNKKSGIKYVINPLVGHKGIASQNQCLRNELHGIYVEKWCSRLEANNCQGNKGSGILYDNDTGGVAEQNQCVNNEQHGIYVSQLSSAILRDNTCNNNKGAGIYITKTAIPDLSNNHCSDNGRRNVDDQRKSWLFRVLGG